MTLDIIKEPNIESVVKAGDIHGEYPYKLYFEIMGNSNIGRYIVVVSDNNLKKSDSINEIVVRLSDKMDAYKKYSDNTALKPNMINQFFVRYRVKEKSIIDVQEQKMMVFKPFKNKN